MTLDYYQTYLSNERELELKNEALIEVMKYYALFSKIESLSFYGYDYMLYSFTYNFTITNKEVVIDESKKSNEMAEKYKIVIKDHDTIYGMLTYESEVEKNNISEELLEKIKQVVISKTNLEKELLLSEERLDVFLIADERSQMFAHELSENLTRIISANIINKNSIASVVDRIRNKVKKSIIIYAIEDLTLLKSDEELIKNLNEVVVVIGPDNYDMSLYCGSLDVHKYLIKKDFLPEQIKEIVVNTTKNIHNKYIDSCKIIALTGITGGVGCTTISMNIANIISHVNHNENVLYVDLSTTKAISNLFLTGNPLPKKTIVDLINSNEYEIEQNLENGLEKIRENFYAINGIQKHIDSEVLSQDIFIEKLLEYISNMSTKFNYIIIDTGVANASALSATIYDLANHLWIMTEMSLAHIAQLKTFFQLLKRAGLKDKLTFLVNRYDAKYALSTTDVMSILNTQNDDNLDFNNKLPNDYANLGYCWNYCELVSETKKESPVVLELENLLRNKGLIEVLKNSDKQSKNFTWKSIFKS